MSENLEYVLSRGPLAVLRFLESCSPTTVAGLTADYTFRGQLAGACGTLVDRAYRRADESALEELHGALALIYDRDFTGARVTDVDHERQPILRDVAARLEGGVLDHELARVPEESVAGYPDGGKPYVHWLKGIVNEHPAGWHPLYHEYFANGGSEADLRLLLAQESTLDPRFDDILAAMQIGRCGGEKLEIAANYWDEMGNGDADQVHTHLFGATMAALGIDSDYLEKALMLEATISGNISACLALSRRHYYKAVGYFGVTEYLAPRRFRCIVDTWRRLGLPEVGITYHHLHIGVDAGHAAGWFKNVVVPLVEAEPMAGREIALGASIRLNTSLDYLDTLLSKLPADS